jgi:mono/diheme cytochrome c family protein
MDSSSESYSAKSLLFALCSLALVTEAQAQRADTFPSGRDLFLEHCAVCHGADATGKGPMAAELKTSPADLTRTSARNQGTFPASRIVEVIRYGGNMPGHGPSGMPVWGKIFSNKGGRGKIGGAYSRRAVVELKRYLETIQQKP